MMIAAPINPSDVIPITGAYAHRVQPPRFAGYEGLGQVVATSSTSPFRLGQRVLPLRGDGTWQQRLNCNGQWLVPVPEDIADDIALRGYINPLAGAGSADNIDRGRIGLCTSVGTMGAGGRGAGGHRPTPRARARAASAPARYTAADDGPPGRAPPAGGALLAGLPPAATVPFARCPGRDVRQRLAERLHRALALTGSRAVIAAGALSAKPLARGAVAVLPVRPRRQASPVSGVVSAGARGDGIRLSASIMPLSAATRRPAGPDSAYRPAVRRWNGGPPDAWAASSIARARHHPAPNAPAAGLPPPALAG